MRVVFAGGGTGGHLFPGVAVAEELRRRDPATEAQFLCTERDAAYARLAELGFEVAVLPGSSRGPRLRRLGDLVLAAARARRLLLRLPPDVVVGLGGYGSVAPVGCAAWLRIPTVLLEQNVVPGRATRWLARVATEVAVQWEESVPYLRRRRGVCVTGNPIRAMVRRRDRAAAAGELGLDPSRPTLLVAGGSQGARPLNERVIGAMPLFAQAQAPVQFVHLAGRADEDRVRAAYGRHGLAATVLGFLEDMALAYSVCDLALSRAGGTSLAELTALGIPAILVPLPQAADDHQRRNAEVLAGHGAAVVLEQGALSPERLARTVLALVGDAGLLARMAAASADAGMPDAAAVVAGRIARLAGIELPGGRPAGAREAPARDPVETTQAIG